MAIGVGLRLRMRVFWIISCYIQITRTLEATSIGEKVYGQETQVSTENEVPEDNESSLWLEDTRPTKFTIGGVLMSNESKVIFRKCLNVSEQGSNKSFCCTKSYGAERRGYENLCVNSSLHT